MASLTSLLQSGEEPGVREEGELLEQIKDASGGSCDLVRLPLRMPGGLLEQTEDTSASSCDLVRLLLRQPRGLFTRGGEAVSLEALLQASSDWKDGLRL